MKDRWLTLNRPQRALLLLQGALVLLSLILYGTLGRRPVLWYGDAPLRCATDGAVATYSGRIDGQAAAFTVSPGPVVEYRYGDVLYGPYTIVWDSAAVPDTEAVSLFVTGPAKLVGVQIQEGSSVLFRGAYLEWDFGLLLFDADGACNLDSLVSPEQPGAAPALRSILEIAVAPQVVSRASFAMFGLGALCCAINAVSLLYADALFRFSLSLRIRNAEDAEPSDWEICGRWIGWIILTVLALILFAVGFRP